MTLFGTPIGTGALVHAGQQPPQDRYAGLVLRLLRDGGPQSRTRLSELTGLSPTTISKTVSPLLALGWIEELGGSAAATRVGRPAIALRQRPGALSVCGIQIGVGIARVGIADAWGRVRGTRTVAFDPAADPGDILARIGAAAREVIAESAGGAGCLAVGVAAPGPVDATHRVNLMSINLGWRDVRIADRLEPELGLPVVVDHNVRSMALAEARYGGHGGDSLAYLYVRTGVGLGLVLKGEPFFGGAHGVSELGHIRVRDDGEKCVCGARGCLETVASEPFLARRLDALGITVPPGAEPPLLQIVEEHSRTATVRRLRADLVRYLSWGLANVVNLLNPEVIVLGGALAVAPETFVADLRESVRSEVFPLLRDAIRIVRPTLTEAGVAAGAAIALESTVYSGPD